MSSSGGRPPVSGSGGPLAPLRRPEYTGDDRCWPCTVANLSIAALGCTQVYLWSTLAGRPAAGVAAAVSLAALALVMVWLRGYLIPGTPVLVRYFPVGALALFGKGSPPTVPHGVTGPPRPASDGGVRSAPSDEGATAATDFDPEEVLAAAGATAAGGLADPFRADWDEALTAVDADGAALAERFALPDETTVESIGRGVVARADGERVGAWESRLALRADLAAAALLADRAGNWDALPARQRGRVCTAARGRRETCPACHAPLSTGPETIRSCCGTLDVVATECAGCDTRLLESPAGEA